MRWFSSHPHWVCHCWFTVPSPLPLHSLPPSLPLPAVLSSMLTIITSIQSPVISTHPKMNIQLVVPNTSTSAFHGIYMSIPSGLIFLHQYICLDILFLGVFSEFHILCGTRHALTILASFSSITVLFPPLCMSAYTQCFCVAAAAILLARALLPLNEQLNLWLYSLLNNLCGVSCNPGAQRMIANNFWARVRWTITY